MFKWFRSTAYGIEYKNSDTYIRWSLWFAKSRTVSYQLVKSVAPHATAEQLLIATCLLTPFHLSRTFDNFVTGSKNFRLPKVCPHARQPHCASPSSNIIFASSSSAPLSVSIKVQGLSRGMDQWEHDRVTNWTSLMFASSLSLSRAIRSVTIINRKSLGIDTQIGGWITN